MKKIMELLVIIHPACDGSTRLASLSDRCTLIHMSEKGLESIISSPDNASTKLNSILKIFRDILDDGEEYIDIIRLKGIIVYNSVNERGRFLKVLSRIFVPRKGLYMDRFNISYVRILTISKSKQYKHQDTLIEKWLGIKAYTKDKIDEDQADYIKALEDKDITVNQAKAIIFSALKQFENSINPYNIMIVNLIIDTLIYKSDQDSWREQLSPFMDVIY